MAIHIHGSTRMYLERENVPIEKIIIVDQVLYYYHQRGQGFIFWLD